MLKTTKKLKLNKEKLRSLTDKSLERVVGGMNTSGTDWCSSDTYNKCGPCNSIASCQAYMCSKNL